MLEAKEPIYADATGDNIDVKLNHPTYGWLDFTASKHDSEEHGRVIYAAALAGEYGEVAPYVAPPPPPPQYKTVFSVLEFRARFTQNEQLAIKTATYTDPAVGLVYDDFLAAQFVDLTDARVEAGIDLYIGKGLLEPDRKAELLAPEEI